MKKLYASIAVLALLLGHVGFAWAHGPKTLAKGADSDDLINQIIKSIPSPLEITVLMKEKKIVYKKTNLNSTDNVSRYVTSFKQALNLGVYSTDLGYANIYGKTQDALSYLKVVNTLAENLTIGDYFDYETLKALAESTDENNLAQLIQTTTTNFEKISNHLREQRRESISILLLTGGWIEATYLTVLIHQSNPSPELREKIGEQKLVLERLLLVLNVYKDKPGFSSLIEDMYKLQEVYDDIEIETIEGPTTVRQVGENVIIEDSTVSNVIMTDEHVSRITSIITSLRNSIIQ
jgi:hypothetical protein